jgi:hypothetical protein
MEGAPHHQQRFALERAVVPDRELLLDLRQFLFRFLDEQLDQIGIRQGCSVRRGDRGAAASTGGKAGGSSSRRRSVVSPAIGGERSISSVLE